MVADPTIETPADETPDNEIPEDRTFELTADESAGGSRLDRWLAERLPELSRSRLKALISEGRVTSGAATIEEPAYRVKPGERFRVTVPAAVPAWPEAQAIPLSVVYEDRHLIVIDKPAGLVVHPAPGNPDRTLVNALLAHCGDQLTGIGGERRPGIVHRLDKDTSGLMVAAKTEAAHASLTRQFAERTIERAYVAVVWGMPSPRAGEIDAPIGRDPRNRQKMAVVSRNGKPALTRYKVIRPLGLAASLVECRLATGRTHQIRVHMASIGHGVIGDPLYGRATRQRLAALSPEGRPAAEGFGRQALHARIIGFSHPESGENLTFESQPPTDMVQLVACLEDFQSEK